MCFVVRPRKHCPFFIVRVIWKENLQRKILWKILAGRFFWSVTFHSFLVTRWNSLVARCSLQKITRYSLQNSLVSRCRSCSLQKITRYSLQKFLVAKNHSLLVANFARYLLQKSLVAEIHSLLVANFARYSLQKLLEAEIHSLLVAKFARYSLQKFVVAKIHSLLVANFACLLPAAISHLLLNAKNHSSHVKTILHTLKVLKERWKFLFFQYNLFPRAKNSKSFQVNIIRWNLLLAEHFQTQQYTNG